MSVPTSGHLTISLKTHNLYLKVLAHALLFEDTFEVSHSQGAAGHVMLCAACLVGRNGSAAQQGDCLSWTLAKGQSVAHALGIAFLLIAAPPAEPGAGVKTVAMADKPLLHRQEACGVT